MRQPLRSLLQFALCLAVLAGCSQPVTPTGSPQTPGTTASAADTATAEPTATDRSAPIPSPTAEMTPTPAWSVPAEDLQGMVLTVLHPFSGELSGVFEEMAAEFSRGNEWGISVSALFTGSAALVDAQLDERLENSETMPSIAVGTAAQVLAWDAAARVTDLKPFSQDEQIGLHPDRISDILTDILDRPLQPDGRRLGLPLLTSPRMLFYNQTWAQELGFSDPPATLDEFRQQACAAAAANLDDRSLDNDGTGGWVVDSEALTLMSWLAAFGVEDVAGDDPLDYQFSQPAAEQAFGGLHEWLAEGCIWLGRQTTGYDYFSSRMALLISGQAEEMRTLQPVLDQDQWIAIPFPGEDGTPVLFTETYFAAVLAEDESEQLAAWLFLRWLTEDNRLARLAASQGSLPPTSTAVLAARPAIEGRTPQWNALVGLVDALRTPPPRASWQLAGMVLEDAGWQLFQPATTAEQIPDMLKMLDETIREVGEHQAVEDTD